MSLIMLAPLIGGAIGPAISGAIAQTMGWRRILVIAAGLAVFCEVMFLLFFRETYKMAILRRRQENSVVEDGDMTHEPKSVHAGAKRLWHSITRPFAVLFGSSVLMLLSLFASVAFSYFYVISVSLPGILVDTYGFELALTGTSFVSFSTLFSSPPPLPPPPFPQNKNKRINQSVSSTNKPPQQPSDPSSAS